MRGSRKSVEFGPAWSPLFLPLLFIGAAVSIPYSAITKRIQRTREEKFAAKMIALGRTIDWDSVLRKIKEQSGTLIVERFSLKGPVRLWWTDENVYELCPHPLVDWFAMGSPQFAKSLIWCVGRYTDPDKGAALLLVASPEERESLFGHNPFPNVPRWIDLRPTRRHN